MLACPNARAGSYSGPAYSGGASVSYTAAVYPLTVNLIGGIGPSTAKHLLIGQQLGATLSSGPLTQTSWSWGASGGSPFKNWVANYSSATYTPLGLETSNQLTCNFAQPSTMASVNCTAHLAVPSGASPSSGLDVTAAQSLIIEKPSTILDVRCGTVTDFTKLNEPELCSATVLSSISSNRRRLRLDMARNHNDTCRLCILWKLWTVELYSTSQFGTSTEE